LIPLRLDIQNFLCYREGVPTLDFTGIHLACLCGGNGHGKSALLDAITWCLWGKARGKTQDELISYGADECRVQLEFTSRNESYRVIRSHSRGGGRRRQGATDLQLQALDGEQIQAVTGNTIRETQAKIEQTVGMDYDTFINTAFLLQGRADEFTNKPPRERQAVLAKILSLETYDLLQDRARSRYGEASASTAELSGRLGEMRRQIKDIGDPSEELEGIGLRLANLDGQLDEKRRETADLREKVNQLRVRRDQLAVLQQRIESIRRDVVQLKAAEGSAQRRLSQSLEVVQQGDTIRKGAARLAEARGQLDALEKSRSEHEVLNQKRGPLVTAIQAARARLEAQIEGLLVRVSDELPGKAAAEPELALGLAEAQTREKGLQDQEREVVGLREQSQSLATAVGESQSTALRYESEGKDLNLKLEILGRPGQENALCPLCQSPLDQDSCGRLAEAYTAQVQEKRNLFRKNRSHLTTLETRREEIGQDIVTREKALLGAQRECALKIQDLQRKILESRLVQQELDEAKTQLDSARRMLDSLGYAAGEQADLALLDRDIQVLDYDGQARQTAYQQTRELQPFEEQERQLTQALESLPQEEEGLARTMEMVARRTGEMDQQTLEYQAETEAITQLPQLEAKLEESIRLVRDLEGKRETAVARQGYLNGQSSRRQELGEEEKQGAQRLIGLEEDQGIYQELTTAFGRRGVQAMLIETVVPRLEEETNILLSRMTDNRMHVKLETQRERASGQGEPIETLEINVSDELGPRSYEMYSGGEAFRVNLAMRIALSKVLAQRIGAPLPTLFIDEGFGTQDAAGRERILDVIGAIQDDFEKIIVITHLEDMKDMFPVRIEVQKDGDGSTFWIS
jgi:exonuclease SbcC